MEQFKPNGSGKGEIDITWGPHTSLSKMIRALLGTPRNALRLPPRFAYIALIAATFSWCALSALDILFFFSGFFSINFFLFSTAASSELPWASAGSAGYIIFSNHRKKVNIRKNKN